MENYHNIKDKTEEIYEKKGEGARIRSKCLWYEKGEKSSKLFLNVEKRRGIQGQIRKIIILMKLILKIHQQTLLRTVNVF